jgi:hypothetical protein
MTTMNCNVIGGIVAETARVRPPFQSPYLGGSAAKPR